MDPCKTSGAKPVCNMVCEIQNLKKTRTTHATYRLWCANPRIHMQNLVYLCKTSGGLWCANVQNLVYTCKILCTCAKSMWHNSLLCAKSRINMENLLYFAKPQVVYGLWCAKIRIHLQNIVYLCETSGALWFIVYESSYTHAKPCVFVRNLRCFMVYGVQNYVYSCKTLCTCAKPLVLYGDIKHCIRVWLWNLCAIWEENQPREEMKRRGGGGEG